MNFDEYDWYFDKSKAPSDTNTDPSQQTDPWALPNVACVGQMCCLSTPGLVYDPTQKVCVLDTSSSLDTSQTVSTTAPTTTTAMTPVTTTPTTTTTATKTTESFTLNKYLRNSW